MKLEVGHWSAVTVKEAAEDHWVEDDVFSPPLTFLITAGLGFYPISLILEAGYWDIFGMHSV